MPEMITLRHKHTRRPLAILDNAFHISYTMTLNNAWTASFSLWEGDEKREFCTLGTLVHIQNGIDDCGLYRIGPQSIAVDHRGIVTYQCEHVITTLFDRSLVDAHVVGGYENQKAVYTREVIQYILSHQKVENWVLGECEFERRFEYVLENQTLLNAIWSVAEPIAEPYMWEWDTSGYPWILHLRKLNKDTKATCRFLDGINIQKLDIEEDTTQLFTRIIPRGYGEGVNQLTIRSVNNGLDYLEAPQSIRDEYGDIDYIWVDRRYEDPNALKEAAQAILDEAQTPRRIVSIEGVDLFPITNDEYDQPKPGKMARVIHSRVKEDYQNVIISVSKSNLEKQNGAVTVSIANEMGDIAKTLAVVKDRQYIEQTHAQGSTIPLGPYSFAENADPSHPITIPFYIPEGMRVINVVNLRCRAENFRADVQGAAAGGGASPTTSTQPAQTSSAGGGAYMITDSPNATSTQGTSLGGLGGHITTGYREALQPDGNHIHDLTPLFPVLQVAVNAHTHQYPHGHPFQLPDHTHTIGEHGHIVQLLAHTHAQIYGIYEGPRASTVLAQIGGRSFYIPLNADFNIEPYLEKDNAGKIKRGVEHTIRLYPNGLTRLSGNVIGLAFIQSREGGTF